MPCLRYAIKSTVKALVEHIKAHKFRCNVKILFIAVNKNKIISCGSISQENVNKYVWKKSHYRFR